MADFHFLRPWWLIGAALCVVLGVVARKSASVRSDWYQVIDPKLAKAIIRRRTGRFSKGTGELIWLMLFLGMLALSGPTWTKQLPDELKDQAAVIILLDNSDSMYAGDIAPNRNQAAKNKIEALRQVLPASLFSVITYAQSAHLVIPLTRDSSFFALFLQPLEPDIMPRQSQTRSGLAQALALARQVGEGAAMPVNLILMSDSLSAQEYTELSQFHQQFPALEVLVIGTEDGAALRFAPLGLEAAGGTGVPLDRFAALKDAGVAVTAVTADNQDVSWLAQRVRGTLVQAQNDNAQWHWQDAGYWLVIALLPLALVLYRQVSALGVLAPLLLLASAYSTDVRADWQSLWWTCDQQGQQALDQGNYAEAGQRFCDPYRKGRAFYLAKDYPQAVEAFRQVKSAAGFFYLANSLAQQQHYQAALKYYYQALLIDPQLTQAQSNAQRVKALLDELAKHSGEREKAEDNAEFSTLKVEVTAPQKRPDEAPEVATGLSDEELKHWMANVKTSPRDMLKALFILQAQEAK